MDEHLADEAFGMVRDYMSVEWRTHKVTPSEAARMLGISADRVRQMIKEGKLAAEMTPLGRLILAKDVEALRLKRSK